MTDERVRVEIDGGVADVRLVRADKRNALDPAMFAAILDAGMSLRDDRSVRAVVLSGDGPDFCAGLDFDSFRALSRGERPSAAVELPAGNGPAAATGQHTVHIWRELTVPVIAAIQGHALGGGLQLALGADIRIVAPDAQLALLEVFWGLVPDMTGTQLLPQLIGLDVAKEFVLTSRRVSGTEAVAMGLATRTDDDPRGAALALARRIAAQNPVAVRHAKQLLDQAGHVDLATGFAAEQTAMAELIGSPNQAEAVRANFEKRAPVFADDTAPR